MKSKQQQQQQQQQQQPSSEDNMTENVNQVQSDLGENSSKENKINTEEEKDCKTYPRDTIR